MPRWWTPAHIKIREWERGTGEDHRLRHRLLLGGGEIGNMLGLCGRSVDVEQIGGILHVDWDDQDVVHMTGPSHIVFDGVLYR